jgi:uncharacterized protein YfaS (alpha-2-macroglobulin family)
VIDEHEFSGAGSVPGADDRYTLVTFLDGNSGRYYGELINLSWTWGDRVDEITARAVAAQLLNDAFGEEYEVPEVPAYNYWSEGVQLLPYASGDFDLTAKFSLLGDLSPFKEQAVWYFENELNQAQTSPLTPRETMEALASLASVGEPVLGELKRASAIVGDDIDAMLWYALGLHAAGDDENARKIYRALMKDEVTSRTGYLYIESDDPETTSERTALLAILAAGIGEPAAEQVFEYVAEQPAGETLLVLDRLIFVKEALRNVPEGAVELSFTLHGSRETVMLEKGSGVSVLVSPTERAALEPQANGTVIVVSRYETPLVDPDADVDASLGVSRTYQTDGQAGTTFDSGDLITIKVRFSIPPSNCGGEGGAPCVPYEVTDVLPSGLTPITPAYHPSYWYEGNTCFDWPSNIEDQRVSFWVYPGIETNCHDGALTYLARVVTPGTYVAEPAYIRSMKDPDTNNHSDVITLTITP